MLKSIAQALCVMLLCASAVHAQVYQWEYIDPANPALGRQQSSTLCPGGAGVNAAPFAHLGASDLTRAYLIGADLRWVSFEQTVLTGADLSHSNLYGGAFFEAALSGTNFAGADVRWVEFIGCFSPSQLYSTASYQSGDLEGVWWENCDLSAANFTGKNLYMTYFQETWLEGADFTGAIINRIGLSGATRYGFTADQLYSTASYASGDLSGVGLPCNDLSGWSFVGKDLRSAGFMESKLTGADFTGATINGASFRSTTDSGFSADQLYGTVSYQRGDLGGVDLGENDLKGWDLSGQSLAGACLWDATLAGADLRGARFAGATCRGSDFRGALYDDGIAEADLRNTIDSWGHIAGLQVVPGQPVRLWDYDGNLAVRVDDVMSMLSYSSLRAVFEDNSWGSTIGFEPGIDVALDGTLELLVNPDEETSIADLVGVTYDLFDWDGANVSGQFGSIVAGPGLTWDTSRLYTTGEVTLTGIPEPATMALLAAGGLALLRRRR